MAVSTHTFQAPKGTRDFYPAQLAVRRYLESVWRGVAVNHGFDEIDGPTFEHLDLYTVKSGPGIVSELFSFRRAGGEIDYALRPEFTPTLARMYAAKASSLPKPTNWFSICPFFRAERPQRGRLREHVQWNLDVIGEDFPGGDTRVLAATVDVLKRFGLAPEDVQINLNHRSHLEATLVDYGFDRTRLPEAITLVDAATKLREDEFRRRVSELGLDASRWESFAVMLRSRQQACEDCPLEHLQPLHDRLAELDLLDWCTYVPSLARGLAYYTGTVFEVFETAGKERAIAGGGRYDNLIELFGGPPTPAVGIAMGDVVIRLVLKDRGLLEAAEACVPRPDVFLISTGTPPAEERFETVLASLRRDDLHVRHSSRATRNVGKLLGEAGKLRARCAVILGDELAQEHVVVKDLDSGEQDDAVPVEGLADRLKQQIGKVGGP